MREVPITNSFFVQNRKNAVLALCLVILIAEVELRFDLTPTYRFAIALHFNCIMKLLGKLRCAFGIMLIIHAQLTISGIHYVACNTKVYLIKNGCKIWHNSINGK